MADYYPLIARAVAGLEKNTGDGRRALYERARAALLAQLRGTTPALGESEITRERLALEEAIRKVEAEYARKSWVEPIRADPIPKMRPPEFPPWHNEDAANATPEPPPPPRRPSATSPPRQQPSPLRPAPSPRQSGLGPRAAPPNMLGDQRYLDPVFDQPLETEPEAASESPPPPPRNPLRGRPAASRRPLSDSGLNDFREVVSETNELGGASARAARNARDNYAAMPAPEHGIDTAEPPTDAHISNPRQSPLDDFPAPRMLEPAFSVEEPHPAASRARGAQTMAREETVRSSRSFRDIFRVALAFILLGCFIGFLAWQWPTMMALYRLFRAPATTNTELTRDATPSTRNKIQERLDSGGQAEVTQPGAAAPRAAQGAAVAQRVVLYEEDPNNPAGQRFVGSAIWRTEMLPSGPGQRPELAIRADVEIPERKIALTWSLRRNTEQTLPASHTVEVEFKLPPDFPFGGVLNVPGILMKQSEQTKGMPLAGLSVKVMPGFFLIGLSAVESDKERNIQLLKERAWFDIPVIYNNNRRAILAIEKGTPGERVFEEAFRAWGQ